MESEIQKKGEPTEFKDKLLKNRLIAMKFITQGRKYKGIKILKQDLKEIRKTYNDHAILLDYYL